MTLFVGTAGWSISQRHHGDRFPAEGSGLARYAARLPAVEINSSFYRSHRAATWQRWASTVPANFRFSVKLPRTITHERKLVDCGEPLAGFVAEIAGLGDRLGAVLVQLPPKLSFDAAAASGFLAALTAAIAAPTALEPRHPSWFGDDADALLIAHRVARVAADPARAPSAGTPGGWRGFGYWRLHGAPEIYRSSYADGRLEAYAAAIRADLAAGRDAWCIFDNTMSAAATGDALALLDLLSGAASKPRP